MPKNKFTPEPKDIVRLTKPKDTQRFGQGSLPTHMRISINGDQYDLKFGGDFIVSSHCDPENKVASLDSKGDLPMIRTEFVQQHINQFKLITKHKED